MTAANPDYMDQPKDFGDYLWTFRRHKKKILGAVGMLFLIAATVALVWPPTYRSTATILIEEQEIPQDLVRSMISSYADQRIQVISQQVMTRANLMQVVEKYKLYSSYRRTHTTEDTLARLRKDIKLDLLKADVLDQRSGSRTTGTIAFTLAYEGEAPEDTQKVTNELVSLYLAENLRNRQQKSAETSTFLAEEAARLSEHISDVEKKLATFKTRNMGRLPELTQLNMQLRDRTDSEIREVQRQILNLDERKFFLESQLAQIKPNTPLISSSGERILDAGERLKTLQAQYASLSSIYSSDHPDVVKMRREIEALQKETGTGADAQEPAKRLIALRAELAAVRNKYSEDHPDVIRLKKAIAALEAVQASPIDARPSALKPENPAYIALQTQLQATASEMKSLHAKESDLRAKMATYEARLLETPQVEREYLDLTRDQETSVARYREIKAKQMQAQISQELEKDRKGERFSLIDPPQLPEQPISPNRPAILLLGFLLSMGGGLASVVVLDSLDHSVRSSKALAGLLQVPLLAVIPYMESLHDKVHGRRVAGIVVASSVGALMLGLLVVHFFWTPLDVLWFRGLRKLDTYAPGIVSSLAAPFAPGWIPWSA